MAFQKSFGHSKHFPPDKSINCVTPPGIPVWQRNYYEHIIRNNAALNRIRQYVKANPAHWGKDRENLNSIGKRGFQTHANRKMA